MRTRLADSAEVIYLCYKRSPWQKLFTPRNLVSRLITPISHIVTVRFGIAFRLTLQVYTPGPGGFEHDSFRDQVLYIPCSHMDFLGNVKSIQNCYSGCLNHWSGISCAVADSYMPLLLESPSLGSPFRSYTLNHEPYILEQKRLTLGETQDPSTPKRAFSYMIYTCTLKKVYGNPFGLPNICLIPTWTLLETLRV